MSDTMTAEFERKALELLPWYVNGTLEGEERATPPRCRGYIQSEKWKTSRAPVSFSTEGTTDVECTGTDSAANEGSDTASVKLDSVAPAIAITQVDAPANGNQVASSATTFPGQKRAIVAQGKVGLASEPRGATILIGRTRPEFCGTYSWRAESRRMERTVT